MSQSDLAFVSSEFDIFAPKPVQHAIQETNVVVYTYCSERFVISDSR
jgi:hypothetical protein